jgi:hypothetical protein
MRRHVASTVDKLRQIKQQIVIEMPLLKVNIAVRWIEFCLTGPLSNPCPERVYTNVDVHNYSRDILG